MGFFAPSYRRRAGATGPAPALTDAYNTGRVAAKALLSSGDALACIGTGFTNPVQVEIDGAPPLATAYVASTYFGTSTGPHSPGVVNLRALNSDGQFSNTWPIRYVADPAGYSAKGWWEQRGDALSYSTTDTDGAGPDVANVWESRAPSTGVDMTARPSGGWVPPTNGTAVDGYPTVRCGAAVSDLFTAATASTLFSLSAGTIVILAKLDASTGAFASGSIAGQCMAFAGAYLAIRAGSVGGGLGKVSFYTESPTLGTYIESSTFPLGTWVLVVARWDGSNMKLRVAGVDATPVSAAAISSGIATFPVGIGHSTYGASIRDELVRVYDNTAWSDAKINEFRDYLQYYRYPSLSGTL